jgi:hypothetical protein
MPHPHGGICRCPILPPDAGLLAFTVDCDHYEQLAAALTRIAGAAQSRVVALPADPDPCDGSMTCACRKCSEERRRRIVHPIRPAKQPWDAAA